jgi:hypothetical protein
MSDEPRKPKRRKTRHVTEADLSLFVQKYGRKAQANYGPNDRHYDRKVEAKIKRMKPEDVDRLMRGDED